MSQLSSPILPVTCIKIKYLLKMTLKKLNDVMVFKIKILNNSFVNF